MSDDFVTEIVFTQAPKAADYSQTTELEVFDLPRPFNPERMDTWRKVKITESRYRVNYQIARYGSFLGGRATPDDPREVSIYDRRML